MMAQQIDKTATEMTDSFSETAVRVTQQVSDANRVMAQRLERCLLRGHLAARHRRHLDAGAHREDGGAAAPALRQLDRHAGARHRRAQHQARRHGPALRRHPRPGLGRHPGRTRARRARPLSARCCTSATERGRQPPGPTYRASSRPRRRARRPATSSRSRPARRRSLEERQPAAARTCGDGQPASSRSSWPGAASTMDERLETVAERPHGPPRGHLDPRVERLDDATTLGGSARSPSASTARWNACSPTASRRSRTWCR